MIQIQKFTVNPFGVNSLVLFDVSKECIIIDPGFSNEEERKKLLDFVEAHQLKVVKLINTHCHIDHILGNRFVKETYKVNLYAHPKDQYNIDNADEAALFYGLPRPNSPSIDVELKEGEYIEFGQSKLKILFTPGHTQGHVCLYSEEDAFAICGDVLFQGSIGRTDLPGGDYDTLIHSIKTQLMILPDDTKVYSGHGEESSIGLERKFNPYLEEI
jgi:hydroxyacylglutathione hydrolase